MNRQQRRARMKLSRTEWSMRMIELRKTMPREMPDDMGIAQLLMGIIVDEQLNVSDVNLATLVGLACGHMELAMQKLPAAKFVNKEGKPMYSEADLAAFTGQTVEETREGIKEFLKESGETASTSADIHPLH